MHPQLWQAPLTAIDALLRMPSEGARAHGRSVWTVEEAAQWEGASPLRPAGEKPGARLQMKQSRIEGRSFNMEPCTTRERHSKRCQNPLCNSPVEPIVDGWRRTERRFCSDTCKQEASLIRRVAKLLDDKSDQEKLSVLKVSR